MGDPTESDPDELPTLHRAGSDAPPAQDTGEAALRARAESLALTHAAHTHAFLAEPHRSIRRTELARPERRAETRPTKAPPTPTPVARGLVMGATLGSGGMGVVRAADQVSLGRQVAVKMLKEELQGEQATLMLLQEAFVMGRIEHPNILPIHDLQYDEASNPQLVLKRIEGVEWRTLMGDAAEVRAQFAEDDLLAWNVRVLMQVCNAIHFAHSRNIIHRDLKPSNVMIGRFGEVYVMDWGLALSTVEDAEGVLPLVEDAKQLAGTPQYMAPEMLGGEHSQLGTRTDVYLLGSLLYEIITDLPPHDGKSMEEILGAVLRSSPSFPPGAPPELVAICRRAMQPYPEKRFASALEMRRALQSFLEHAGSRRLEAQGGAVAVELLRLTAPDAPADTDAALVQERFAQCRFAYRQALEIWPGNRQAARGLHAAVVHMVRYELAGGNPRTAAQLLGTLQIEEPLLAAEVDQALSEQAHAQQRMHDLERIERETSIETGSRNRAIVAGLLGLSWTAAPLLGLLILPLAPHGLQRAMPSLFALGVVLALSAVWLLGREEIRQSRLTQYLLGGAIVAMGALWATEAAGYVLGLPMELVQSLWPLTWFCISAMLAMTVDRRMLPMTLGFLGALALSVVWPGYRFQAMTASNFVMTVNMFSIWLRPLGEGELSMMGRMKANLGKRAGG